MNYREKVSRQLVLFVLIGGFQFALDTLLLWLLLAMGLSVGVANISSRAIAAVSGLYLNRQHTFGVTGQTRAVSWRLHLRFWVFWACMTAISTVLLKAVPALFFAEQAGNAFYLVMTKVGVEIFLFFLSFFISRQLVFRDV